MFFFLAIAIVIIVVYSLIYLRSGWPEAVRFDKTFFFAALVISILLGVWGGIENWADSADYLSYFIMGTMIPSYSVIEGLRMRDPLRAGAMGAAIGFACILVSSIFWLDPDTLLFIAVLIGEGALLGSASAAMSANAAKSQQSAQEGSEE